MTAQEDRVARLIDRLEIEELLYRYARGVDRRDWDAVRATYHPDAYDDHGNYKGGIDGFIESLKKRHAMIEQSMHVVTNCIIEFDGPDSALVESYFITFQRVLPEAGDARRNYLCRDPLGDGDAMQGQAVGRYVDQVTRRNGEWRVARRTVVFDLYHGWPTIPGGGLKPHWAISRRDGQDHLQKLRTELGFAQDQAAE